MRLSSALLMVAMDAPLEVWVIFAYDIMMDLKLPIKVLSRTRSFIGN